MPSTPKVCPARPSTLDLAGRAGLHPDRRLRFRDVTQERAEDEVWHPVPVPTLNAITTGALFGRPGRWCRSSPAVPCLRVGLHGQVPAFERERHVFRAGVLDRDHVTALAEHRGRGDRGGDQSRVGEEATAGMMFTFPCDWPSTRIWIGQARPAVGFSAVQLTLPENVITAELAVALVANEVNAVGMSRPRSPLGLNGAVLGGDAHDRRQLGVGFGHVEVRRPPSSSGRASRPFCCSRRPWPPAGWSAPTTACRLRQRRAHRHGRSDDGRNRHHRGRPGRGQPSLQQLNLHFVIRRRSD